MGDNIAIRAETQRIRTNAEKYPGIMDDHEKAMKKVEEWTGEAADLFKKSMHEVTHEIEAMGLILSGIADIMSTVGACVGAVRAVARDVIAMILGDIVAGAFFAAALAIPTFGASIVGFLVDVGIKVASTLSKLWRLIKQLTALLRGNRAAVNELGIAMTTVSNRGARRLGRITENPGPSTPNTTPPPSTPLPHPGPSKTLWENIKKGMETLQNFSEQTLKSTLVDKFGTTAEEAAAITKWIKNFEEFSQADGKIRIDGKEYTVGWLVHYGHELWKELANKDGGDDKS